MIEPRAPPGSGCKEKATPDSMLREIALRSQAGRKNHHHRRKETQLIT